MKPTLIAALSVVLILSGCERSQVNYETPKPADRWVLNFTGNEMVWWGVGGLILFLVDQAARRDD